jgi:hypothetical protein
MPAIHYNFLLHFSAETDIVQPVNSDARAVIDLSQAPHDPLERLVWLSGARQVFEETVNAEWQRAYYDARVTGRLDAALRLGLHSRKRVLGWTRAENERQGRAMRWGDGY